MMPPRRELPFQRPYSRNSDGIKKQVESSLDNPTTASRAMSVSKRPSTADLPPLRPPTYATRSATIAMKKDITATEEQSNSVKLPPTQERDTLSSQYFTTALEPSASMHTIDVFPETTYPPSSTLGRPSSAVTDKAEITRRKAASSIARDHQDDPETHRLADLIRTSTRSRDLQSYTTQPQDVRGNLLNEFFVECIEDDDFQLLCQDVASSWRRIGLGLQ